MMIGIPTKLPRKLIRKFKSLLQQSAWQLQHVEFFSRKNNMKMRMGCGNEVESSQTRMNEEQSIELTLRPPLLPIVSIT